jgi:hypothetical protein
MHICSVIILNVFDSIFLFVYIKFNWNFARHFRKGILYKTFVDYIISGFFKYLTFPSEILPM